MLGSIRRPEEEEVFGVHDWAEVHRLDREGFSKRAIARRLAISHTTVHRLLGLGEPPRYERRKTSSLVGPFASEIASMLDCDPKVPATVVLQHLRRDGYAGGITILKEHLAKVRPVLPCGSHLPTHELPARRDPPRLTGGTRVGGSRSARELIARRSVSLPRSRTRRPTRPCSRSAAR